jgi:dienelactone hydrolase
MNRYIFLWGFLLLLLSGLDTDARPMEVADVGRLKRPNSVILSPSGREVAYMMGKELWVDVQKVGGVKSAQWRPDGGAISWISSEDASVVMIWERPSPPRVLVTCEGLQAYRWSGDGTQIGMMVERNGVCRLGVWDVLSRTLTWVKGSEGVTRFEGAFDGGAWFFGVGKQAPLARVSSSSLETSPQFLTGTEGLFLGGVNVSDDGQWLYGVTQDEVLSDWLRVPYVVAYSLKTGAVKRFKSTGEPGLISVYQCDGQFLYYLAEDGVGYRLYRLNMTTGETTPKSPAHVIRESFSFSLDRQTVAFIQETSAQPPEIFLQDLSKQSIRQVTQLNESLSQLNLSEAKMVTWNSPGGGQVEAMLIRPVGYREGQKYPLLVIVHGGPAETVSNRFANGRWNYPTQVLAGKGIMILMPNPRGSTGYGTAFKLALKNQWGRCDAEDVMAGVDFMCRTGQVDLKRIGVAGWSYGGFLTSVLITRYPDRFKVASIGAGFSDLTTLYGTIDIPDWIEGYFEGKTPYTHPEFFQELSPIYRMDQVRVPVLIQGGVSDVRVPISQSRLLHRRLKSLGKPVKLTEYPAEGHIFSNPVNRQASLLENVDWFLKWL